MHPRLGILCHKISHYAIIKTKSTLEFLKIHTLGATQTAAQDILKKKYKENCRIWCHLVYDKWNPCELCPDAKHVIHS